MIDPVQLAGFRDELTLIYSEQTKLANMSGAQTNSNQIQTQAAPPPAAMGAVKVKAPPKGGTLGGPKPTYSKVNSTPTTSPAVGQQNLASPPAVKA